MSTSSTIYTPPYSASDTDSSSGISFDLDDVDPSSGATSSSTDDEEGWHIDGYGKAWLPRLRTEAKATVLSTSTHLTLIQTFENPSQYRLIKSSAYSFPLYPHATVVSMHCKFRDRLLIGKVEPKPKAKAIFKEAVESGQRAALLQEVTVEVFTVELGNIAPQESVEVRIEIICEIKHDPEQDSIRFVLPRSIGSRYGSAPAGIASNEANSALLKVEVGILMPEEIRAITNPNQPMTVIYGELPGEPKRKKSDQANEQIDSRKATVQLVKDSDGFLIADFVLMIQLKRFAKSMPPFALLEQHPTKPGNMAVMASLVPRFSLPLPEAKPEIIFVVDLSGSMRANIPKLRSALEVFLKSLPLGIQFNICFFGNKFRFLFPEGSREYSAETLKLALAETRVVEANMGGTKLYGALYQAFEQRHQDIKSTEIIVLTDGEIWGPENIFNLIRQQREAVGTDGSGPRVFSLGIGDNVSHHLVEGLAEAGGGFSIFAQNNEAFSDKIVRLLTAALSVRITNLKVELEFEDGKDCLVSNSTSTVQVTSISTCQPATAKNSKARAPRKKISLMDSDSDDAETEDLPDKIETIQLSQASQENRYAHLRDLAPPNPLQSPSDIRSLFPHQRAVIFLLYQQDAAISPSAAKSIRITAKLSTGDTTEPLSIPITMAEKHQNLGNATMIHSLAARSIIKDMEQGKSWLETGDYGISRETDPGRFGEYVAREAERLGMEWGIVSKWTSLVAVELALNPPPNVDQVPTAQVAELTNDSAQDAASQQSHEGSRVFEAGALEEKATVDTTVVADDGNKPVRLSCVDGKVGSGKASEQSKKKNSGQTSLQTEALASAPPPASVEARGFEPEGRIASKITPERKRAILSPSQPGIRPTAFMSLAIQDSSSPFHFPESSGISMWTMAAGNPGLSVTGTRTISGVVSTDGLDYANRKPSSSRRTAQGANRLHTFSPTPRPSFSGQCFSGSANSHQLGLNYSQHGPLIVDRNSYSQHERRVVWAARRDSSTAPAMNQALDKGTEKAPLLDRLRARETRDRRVQNAIGKPVRFFELEEAVGCWEAPDSLEVESSPTDQEDEHKLPMWPTRSPTAQTENPHAPRKFHQDSAYTSAGKNASPEPLEPSASSPEQEQSRSRFLRAVRKRSRRDADDSIPQSEGGDVDLELINGANKAASDVEVLQDYETTSKTEDGAPKQASPNPSKLPEIVVGSADDEDLLSQKQRLQLSEYIAKKKSRQPAAAAPKPPALARPLTRNSESQLQALVSTIISYQEFDGSFNFQDAATADEFANEVYNLTGVRLDLTGNPEKDTTVCIVFLEEECKEFSGTWSLVVEKARKWILSLV